ncbi:hypothetical protein [Methylobacterium sp.]|uniref:hypothetical protein n=1 Tax=Methylobacterium sp. TaxID=409 RepID=UPI000C56017E|nr:hypothetical protein [Methylobacterium sp.]MBP30427.1 hypothetical protein [Methylobacterium sp.]
MPVTKTVDRTDQILAAANALTKLKAYVGIPAEASPRQPDGALEDQPPSNAVIGYLMENGAPERNLPARPHLLPGIEAAMPQITPQLEALGKAALLGDLSAIQKGLTAVGIIGENAVKAQITDGTFAPLSERTLKARQARGRTGTKPLIDTGQYRRAITHVVK